MKEPVDHILRPTLPWRSPKDGAITECGYDATKVKTLTRAEYFQRLKDLGQQRAAMVTCMTCANTARRWGSWEDDPRLALQREIEWERPGYYRHSEPHGQRLKDELLAIASIIAAHPEVFAAMVAEAERRRDWISKKAEVKRKSQTVPPKMPGL